jgi:hypothetical protein
VHFDATIVDFKTAANGDNETFKKILSRIITEEFILRHRPYIVGLCGCLTYEDLDFTVQTIDKVSKLLNKKLPAFTGFSRLSSERANKTNIHAKVVLC